MVTTHDQLVVFQVMLTVHNYKTNLSTYQEIKYIIQGWYIRTSNSSGTTASGVSDVTTTDEGIN